MPENNAKMTLYSGSKKSYLRTVNNNEVDENGIYFINGVENEIYVGDKLYGSGSSVSNIKHIILHCHGTIQAGNHYVREVSNVRSVSPISILLGGVYINGLRAVSEIKVILTVTTISDSENTYYVPTIDISSNNDYLDTYTEITIDLYVSESLESNISDVVTTELVLDTQTI